MCCDHRLHIFTQVFVFSLFWYLVFFNVGFWPYRKLNSLDPQHFKSLLYEREKVFYQLIFVDWKCEAVFFSHLAVNCDFNCVFFLCCCVFSNWREARKDTHDHNVTFKWYLNRNSAATIFTSTNMIYFEWNEVKWFYRLKNVYNCTNFFAAIAIFPYFPAVCVACKHTHKTSTALQCIN